MVTIAHISDPHVGSPCFVPNLMNRVIVELNELEADVVVCTGDLTNEGLPAGVQELGGLPGADQGARPDEPRDAGDLLEVLIESGVTSSSTATSTFPTSGGWKPSTS
jgi:3',5'-cyclic AMP phosphodiesterase CpdA